MTSRRQPVEPAESGAASELRALARVIITAAGVVSNYWDMMRLAPGHPYRHAMAMIVTYLRQRYCL